MIGNDIVDLALAQQESNWKRKGFLHKIFTPYERQLIRTAPDPDQMVWLLWSMKESAYKIAIRASGKRHFAPAKLECQLTELDHKGGKGIVCYVGKEYVTKYSFTTQYMATVSANRNDFLNSAFEPIIVSLPVTTYLQQHQHLWKKIQQYCGAALCVPEKEISFHKDETGAPWLTLSSAERVPLSVSHHGRFGAFVLNSAHFIPTGL